MTQDPLAKIIEWIRLPSQYLFELVVIAAIATGALVLAPERLIEDLGLKDFRANAGVWLPIGFVLTVATLLARGVVRLVIMVGQHYKERRLLKLRQKSLHDLTPEEGSRLAGYIKNQTRTQSFRADDGVAKGLVTYQIIYRSASVGDAHTGFDHNIQPWAWEYLNENPHLVSEYESYKYPPNW